MLRLLFRSWNEKKYKYKIIKFTTSLKEVNELNEYVFVLHVKINKLILT